MTTRHDEMYWALFQELRVSIQVAVADTLKECGVTRTQLEVWRDDLGIDVVGSHAATCAISEGLDAYRNWLRINGWVAKPVVIARRKGAVKSCYALRGSYNGPEK